MPEPSDSGLPGGAGDDRRRLMGLGDRSFKKSYYPELRKRLSDLERFRALLDRAGEAIFLCDLSSGLILDANEATRERFGFSSAEPEPRIEDFVPGPIREIIAEAARGIEIPGVRRVVLSGPRGGSTPFEVSVALRLFGESRHALVVARDISEQAAAEEATRQAQAKYRVIYENAPVGIYRSTPSGRYLDANRRFADMFGYDTPEWLMERVTDIGAQIWRHPADRATMLTILEAKGEVRGYEAQNRRADGSLIWTSRTVRLVRDERGAPAFLEGFVSDVTDRKLAEENLAKTRNYIKNIIDSMPSVMVGVDPLGLVTHWNLAAERETGVSSGEAKGRPLREVFPDLSGQMARVVAAVDARTPMATEKMAVPRGGNVHYQDVLVYPLVANGVEGAVIRVDDVTDRVRIEEMMLQSEKMFSLGGLAAGMAHEINNPLGAVLQGLQNIKRRLLADLPANTQAAGEAGLDLAAMRRYLEKREVIKFIDGIREAGERAAAIVSNMLDFSRRGDTRLRPADLTLVMEKTLALAANDYDLKKRFDFRQIEIVREFEPGLPPALCVASEIEQVFLNVLKNAAQALSEGGRAGETPRIVLRMAKELDNIRIEIQDNGPGMEETVRKRIFEPFFTTKEPGVGTGLGLSVSYFIVTHDHNGSFTVESEPGRGAKCVIRLPAKEGA
jgi:PAS domain S-box-containing protein